MKNMTHNAMTMKSSFARNIGAVGLATAALVNSASAEIPVTVLTSAITDGIDKAEGLIIAGFAALAIFIVVKLIKKGVSKVA